MNENTWCFEKMEVFFVEVQHPVGTPYSEWCFFWDSVRIREDKKVEIGVDEGV